MQLIRQIPNLFTLLNLLCGCLTVLALLNLDPLLALKLHIASLTFDFFDGLIARALKSNSPLGVQLDSLADMVSFGVVPGVAMYTHLAQILVIDIDHSSTMLAFPLLLAFLLTLGAAVRLGRFNLLTEYNANFVGLPTPAMTMFFIGLSLFQYSEIPYFIKLVNDKVFIFAMIFLFTYQMNSKVEHFKIKAETKTLSNPIVLIVFSTAIGLLLFEPFLMLSVVIFLYTLLSTIIYLLKQFKFVK